MESYSSNGKTFQKIDSNQVIDGNAIRKKRKELGLTAQELADLLNVSKENLYKWEKGTRPNNPEDYSKLRQWLSTGKVESEVSVPAQAGKSKFSLDPQDYIDELKHDKRVLEGLIRDNQEIIRVNLNTLQELVKTLFRHDLAYHRTILRALARLEKNNKDQNVLIEAADRLEAEMMVEELKVHKAEMRS